MISFIQTNATPIIAFFTLLSNLIFVVVILAMLIHAGTRVKLHAFIHKYILELLFWAVSSAVVGSLIYSQIIGFPPCDLCWWERIFMYPQAIILFVAMRRKDKGIIDYLVPLSVIGAILSLYQSFVQWGFGGSLFACTATGSACAKVYVLQYSYITIPFMSFTVFAYIIALKYIYYRHNKKIGK
jgi:disulfide bond formation protein DsbB